MVSLWPWRRDDSSTSSFEKTLSTVTTKITKTSATGDSLRSRSRRLKALWTIYTGFAYILCALILTLVTGYSNWGIAEYAAIIGSPFMIYGVRTALNFYYNYRLSSNQAYLDQLHAQREDAIEKFKTATKYNTTQQLLEKYGAAPKTPPSAKSSSSPRSKKAAGAGTPSQPVQRTGLPPPPTANIRRPEGASTALATPPPAPAGLTQRPPPQVPSADEAPPPSPPAFGEEFANNAYAAPPQYVAPGSGNWYDRVLDLLLGEDETRPGNRLALICASCKLVNGQAPPGVRSLEEVGRWRCMSCRAWNGSESAVETLLKEVGGSEAEVESPGSPGAGEEMAGESLDGEVKGDEEVEVETEGVTTRSRTAASGATGSK